MTSKESRARGGARRANAWLALMSRLFTLVFCLGAGLARSVPMLLAARVVQGLGPALLVPGSLAIVRTVLRLSPITSMPPGD